MEKRPAKQRLFQRQARWLRASDTASRRWYARRSSVPGRSSEQRVDNPVEPTAQQLWNDVSRRLRDTLNESTYVMWFASAQPVALREDAFVLIVPNQFSRTWITSNFLGLLQSAVRDTLGREIQVTLEVVEADGEADGPVTATPAATVGDGQPGVEPEVHVRQLRDRVVEPLRARGGAGRRRGAGTGLQPALHLRRHGSRQDTPAAGDRRLRQRSRPRAHDAVRDERDVHERLHQLAPRQADRGVQAPLPRLRRAARRRHPVPRGQGARSRRSSSTPSTRSTRQAGRS